jgi:hypothetical protein
MSEGVFRREIAKGVVSKGILRRDKGQRPSTESPTSVMETHKHRLRHSDEGHSINTESDQISVDVDRANNHHVANSE